MQLSPSVFDEWRMLAQRHSGRAKAHTPWLWSLSNATGDGCEVKAWPCFDIVALR